MIFHKKKYKYDNYRILSLYLPFLVERDALATEKKIILQVGL